METNPNKIKILLVDDDEMMRIYFRDIFWMHGRSDVYEIDLATSVEEAEKIIENKDTRPDTVFLDVMMSTPGVNNNIHEQIQKTLNFVKKIKENKDFCATKIIIYSGQKEKKIEKAFSELKVDGFLIKGEMMPREIIAYTDQIHGKKCNN